MPIHGCTRNGKPGHKWGARGRCYTGPGSKARAARQAGAAYAHGYRGKSAAGGPCGDLCTCDGCLDGAAFYAYRASSGHLGLVHLNRKSDVKTDDGEMSASAVLASSRRDRQGDVIECSGVEFEDHRWNPVVLWDHGRQYTVPIGLTETPRGEYTVSYHREGDLITQKTYFAPTKFARQIYGLVRQGFVRANSIAVKDLEVEKLPPDPGAGHFKPGKHILRSSLAEVTWTPLPANPDAVRSLLSARRVDCGGFGTEQLSGIICKSFEPYLPGRRAWANGVTFKRGTGVEKKSMSDELDLTRRGDGGEYEDEVGDDTAYKDEKPQPPGSRALHDMHDAYKSVKDVLGAHHGQQEHPKVAKLVASHLQDVEDTMASLRDAHEQIYPDHEAPADEALDEKDEVGEGEEPARTTPEAAGEGELGEDVEGGGDRVEDEERTYRRRKGKAAPARVPASRKSYRDPALEALRRTVERKRQVEAELMEDLSYRLGE